VRVTEESQATASGIAGGEPAPSRRRPVLEVLRKLLVEGGTEESVAQAVLALVAKLVARNSELEQRLAKAASLTRKNEGISTAQLLLMLDELTESKDAELAKADAGLKHASGVEKWLETAETEQPPPQPPARKPAPPELRRMENVIAVPEAERPCPKCGQPRECIGHDVTEVVDLIPAEVVVRLDKREKLACRACEGEVVRAPTGDKVVAGGKLGSGLVARVVKDKYWDGLPLHRQKERFAQLGFPVAVSTLADQVTWGTDLLRPLWRSVISHVLAAKVMHLDGTGLAVLDRDAPTGIKLGSLWGYVGVTGEVRTALYLYASTGKKTGQRTGELGPEDMLSLREGYTVADASSLFDKSFKRPELIECGCNMHSRRYFLKALDGGDTRAALPLAAFKTLYKVEEEVERLSDDERLAARRARSKPVYDELISWCRTHKPYEPPSSALGKAIQYLLNHEMALKRFLEDGAIPVDNGVVERLHVRTALTRNYAEHRIMRSSRPGRAAWPSRSLMIGLRIITGSEERPRVAAVGENQAGAALAA
jgi:transposase